MKEIFRALSVLLCVVLVEVPFSIHAHAGMIPTSEVASSLVLLERRKKVEQFMQREDVRSQFAQFGVNPDEASKRVAAMTDAEVHRIAGEIESRPAGADVIVIGLTTVLLVIIILLLIGKI